MNVSLKTLALLLECKAEREVRADLEALLCEAREWDELVLRFVVEHAAVRLEVDLD